jgi:hypothetical protein
VTDISLLPKLSIKYFGNPGEDVCELDQAKYILDFDRRIIVVEGKKVKDYADLVRLAGQDKYRNMESIEVVVLPTLMGG